MRADINKKVQFVKIRDVKSPNRANKHDAGTDFYMPNYSEEFVEVLKEKNANNILKYTYEYDTDGNITNLMVIVPAGEQINVPSGIRVWINDKNTYLEAENKSGIASKKHLAVMAKVIDADYQGEIHINLANVGNNDAVVKTGEKLTQFIHREYIDTDWEELASDEEYYNMFGTTDRGNGGFGSTTLQ